MSNSNAQHYHELVERERRLRIDAGRVMQELRDAGGDWQEAWRSHPVAIAYRELLREAWAGQA